MLIMLISAGSSETISINNMFIIIKSFQQERERERERTQKKDELDTVKRESMQGMRGGKEHKE